MDLNLVNGYLIGNEFSGGLKVKVAFTEKSVLYRIPFLETLAKNKRIIHIGCVDHVELLNDKIVSNTWLHKILKESAKQCIGIDINRTGIEFLMEKGYRDVYYLDIINDDIPDYIKDQHWDYMILGEILEHVDNPVFFLSALKAKYANIVDYLIITVPNAYTLMNLISIFRNTEIINSDHRYWFTPYTLGKICIISGFNVDSYYFARKSVIKSVFPIKNFIFRFFPILRDTLIFILKT